MVQRSGPEQKYTKIFNVTCEVDSRTLTGKWNGSPTCVCKFFNIYCIAYAKDNSKKCEHESAYYNFSAMMKVNFF